MVTRGGAVGVATVTGVIDITASPYNCVADSNGTHLNGTDNAAGIAAAVSNSYTQGKAIYIPPTLGYFRHTNYWDFTFAGKPIHVFGGGRGMSKIFSDVAPTGVGWQVQNASHVHMHDFTIRKYSTGTRSGGGSTMFIPGCTNVLFQNMEWENADAMLVYMSGCTRAIVMNCWAHDSVADGIHFEDGNDCIAIGNMCWNNKDDALASVTNSAGAGPAQQNRVTFVGNIIKDCDARGIVAAGGIATTITGNVVHNTANTGIFTDTSAGWGDDTHELIISDNAVTNGGMKAGGTHSGGIFILRIDTTNTTDNILISNNVIKTPRYWGIRVGKGGLNAPTNKVQIIGNQVYGPITTTNDGVRDDPGFYAAISAVDCIDCIVEGNLVENVPERAIVVYNDAAATLAQRGLTIMRNNTAVRASTSVSGVWPAFDVGKCTVLVQGNVARDPGARLIGTNGVRVDATAVVLASTPNYLTTVGPA